MLGDYTPAATIAVTDLSRAREFYESVLGFRPSSREDVPDAVALYECGDGVVLVYPSAYAGTNKATAIMFQVPDDAFDAEVAALRAQGLVFQTFEMEEATWEDGVASWAGQRSVWFEDPDGNILNVWSATTG